MPNNPGSVHDKSKDLGSSLSHAATDVKNKAQDLGSAAMHQAKDTASNLADKAKDAASNVGSRVSDAASYVGHRAEDATSSAGGGLKSLASQVRQNAPHEGMLGSAAGYAAGALDRTGDYLREQGLSGMAEDFTGLIRRNPIPALLIGVAVGFLVARATSSRS
jgi:phage-related tail protein